MTGLTLFDFDFSGDKPGTPFVLRPDQERDVAEIMAKLEAGGDPLLVMPTGGGKTVEFCAVTNRLVKRRKVVWIFAHRQELLSQASRKVAAYGVGHGLIMPRHPMTADTVQVASIDTVAARLDQLTPRLAEVDVAIFDEAHHATAPKYQRVIERLTKARRVGATATPFRTDGTGLGGVFTTAVQGLSMRQLISIGALAPVHVYRPPFKQSMLKGIRKVAGDYSKRQLETVMDTDEMTQLAIKSYKRWADGLPTVVFSAGVDHAHHLAAAFQLAGYGAAAVDGETPGRERDRALADLADGKIQLLMSYDLVGEGVDIPVVAAGLDLRPTMSTIIYQQHIGRTMRTSPGKEAAIWIDQVANYVTHGMPEEERPWTLKGGTKGRERAVTATMLCGRCRRAHAIAPSCPGCSKVYPKPKERAEPAHRPANDHRSDAERDATPLGGFTDAQIARMNHKALTRLGQSKADFERIANIKGYKPGWVYYRVEELELRNAARRRSA